MNLQRPISLATVKALGLATVCILVGCASKPTYNSTAAANANRQIITNSKGVPNYYQVKQGDTVSKIAQRYGLDWREVGKLNKLTGNYVIYTGQWLTLWTGSGNDVQGKNSAVQTPNKTTQPRQTTTAQAPKPQAQTPVQTQTQARSKPPVAANTNGNAPFAAGSVGVMQFRYPVGSNNPVVRRFGTANVQGSTVTSNGMWFSGADGDEVKASRAGTVIHADGNIDEATIAIQHTDGFVSSYIHIKNAKVKSGDSVRQGQSIASMKKLTSNSALLEFRIAKNGTYIDPLTVLK